MPRLHGILDEFARTLVLSGQGTYAARDEIKKLGKAIWVQDKKHWLVTELHISADEIRARFPDIVIDASDRAPQQESQAASVEQLEVSVSTQIAEVASLGQNELVSGPTGYSVSQLLSEINDVLRAFYTSTILVYGVITKVTRSKNRVFLQLSDPDKPDEELSCAIWAKESEVLKPLVAIGCQLEPDLQVMFRVQVGMNRKRGQVSLTIVGVVAEYTLLKLTALREKTNKRLIADGIFDRNKLLPFPFLPRRIGILTSASGTVINDFRSALDEARFGFELFWCQVSVQGIEAKGQIIAGLNRLATAQNLDLILLFRGGGSVAELSVFNDYDVARAICLSPIPVLSAVGHEADLSSAQDVSYRAFGVPKDLGRFLRDIVLELRAQVLEFSEEILTVTENQIRSYTDRLREHLRIVLGGGQQFVANRTEHLGRIVWSLPVTGRSNVQRMQRRILDLTGPIAALGKRRIEIVRERLFFSGDRLVNMMRRALEKSSLLLQSLIARVEASSPEVQLKRGFTIIRRESDKKLIPAGGQLVAKDEIEIEFHDQVRKAVVR